MNRSQEIEETLFEAVMALGDAPARKEFLDLLSSGDVSLARRLRDLCEARTEADRYFRAIEGARTMVALDAGRELISEELPVTTMRAAAEEEPGQRIGRYRLMQRIGEGGCGIVYLAEQEEPVKRMVALKVIRLGMDTERVIARFEAERQSLALMDHPNIARVLDAGTTDTGRPYFVMEWVRGLRITDFCDENRLDLTQRIDLFLAVCKGIQHAHQKGVIHRDIKPSNILISQHDGKASPKVIDFGVAKAMESDAGMATALTYHDAFVGTPVYMSPEQADGKGQDVDTRSDVYSLGILLYELLAGRTPFDSAELAAAGMLEMRRILVEREPRAPSAMLAALPPEELRELAALRRMEPTKVISRIRGGLDWVVMKALEKDRQRRYETANGLMMDLQRFLAHEPVVARHPSQIYLFRRFVRRNRVAVGVTAAIVGSLLLGLGVASISYLGERKSRKEQERLRQVAEVAHTNELKRLAQANEWENFAQASILLSEGKTVEADAKLRESPLSSIRLTPQTAGVLRSLGSWNALRGRWSQASECYNMLMRANDLKQNGPAVESVDLLAIGPALIEGGSREEYQRFRAWSLRHFQDTSTPLSQERVLHSTLLAPADMKFLRELGPLAERLRQTEFDPGKLQPGWETESAIWRAWALALLEYRRGDWGKSMEWAERARGLGSPQKFIAATISPVLAMARYRLGDREEAKKELAAARAVIDSAFTPDLPAAYEPLGKSLGFWWDWVVARILFREAERLIEGPESR